MAAPDKPRNAPNSPDGSGATEPSAAGLVDGIISMYRQGWFPMADPDTGRVDWFQPRRRGVIPLGPGEFTVSRSLRQRVRSGRFEIRTDTAFRRVISACGEPREREGKSWIDRTIIEAYCLLNAAGKAHSVEAWRRSENGNDQLVGGLYGVHVGGVFFGESMFSRPGLGGTDASKVCLVHLVHHMRRRGMVLLDAQLWNEHLHRFGCLEMSSAAFMRLLKPGLAIERAWGPFEPGSTVMELCGRGGGAETRRGDHGG